MLEKSSTSYLGPGDRGFKSRSPDQNRQFSVRKTGGFDILERLFFVYSAIYFETRFIVSTPG